MELTPSLCRAARALVGMSQVELAETSAVSRRAIIHFELGERSPRPATLDALRRALEKVGVQFIEENGGGPGVRLRKGRRK
jgi:transcriptional regulator with XRE-family HTH domain